MHQTIAVIGAGHIGHALIGGLITGGHIDPSKVRATRRNPNALDILHEKLPRVSAGTDNEEVVKGASIVVLSVKPANWPSVAEEIRDIIEPDPLIVPVLAGLTTVRTGQEFPNPQPVIRTMPNMTMVVDKGATAICVGESASREHLGLVQEIFESVGKAEQVPEYLMDAVTGLSGSGPAYAYMLIGALTDACVKRVFPLFIGFKLTKQTVLGATQLAEQTDKHPA